MGMVAATKRQAWPFQNQLQEFDPVWKPRKVFSEEVTPELRSEYN